MGDRIPRRQNGAQRQRVRGAADGRQEGKVLIIPSPSDRSLRKATAEEGGPLGEVIPIEFGNLRFQKRGIRSTAGIAKAERSARLIPSVAGQCLE